MKTQINFRASDFVADRIEQLKSWLNQSQTGVIETAINQLFETERTKKMNLQILTETVARAVARMETEGIKGWGLGNPDENIFSAVQEGAATGCTSQTCHHNSHDPAASMMKLIPVSGKIVNLGSEWTDGEVDHTYYVLITDAAPKFYELTDPRHYWASLQQIEAEQVPEWAMANLATV